MSRFLQILTVAGLSAVNAGTTITSKNCGATIYFDEIKLSGSNEELISLISSDEDPCIQKTSGNEANSTFSFKTSDGKDLIFNVLSSQGKFMMTSIVYDAKSFRPRQSWNIANSYTLAPSGSLGSTFVCQYTTFSYVNVQQPDQVQTLTFSNTNPFVLKMGESSDGNLDDDINQCVGIMNEGTILGTITLLFLLLKNFEK